MDDLRESLEVSLERGWTREIGIGFNNYGSWLWASSGAGEALPVYREGIEVSERRGAASTAIWTRGESTWPLFDLGLWDEVLETVDVVDRHVAEYGGTQPLLMGLASKGRVLFYRGRMDEAAAIARDLVPRARAVGDFQIRYPALSLAALVEADAATALALVEEAIGDALPTYPDSARVCVRHGAFDLAERMIRVDERSAPRDRHVAATVQAIVAEGRGERDEAGRLYAEAARRWREYPFMLERGLCLLGLARVTDDAAAAQEARAIFRSLGADPLEGEAAAA